jgi:hypothetical protein
MSYESMEFRKGAMGQIEDGGSLPIFPPSRNSDGFARRGGDTSQRQTEHSKVCKGEAQSERMRRAEQGGSGKSQDYSGPYDGPDQQAWIEGLLKPNNRATRAPIMSEGENYGITTQRV